MLDPARIETARLVLRRPRAADAEAIFSRYASDPEVTRYLSWPTHWTLADTGSFLAQSDASWRRWPVGPYVIESRADGRMLGSTGLAFETDYRAQTGYVVARDAWGQGYATEALGAMVDLAAQLGVVRLYALCHVEHSASQRVLEKAGLVREARHARHTLFPNLDATGPGDVLCYARLFT